MSGNSALLAQIQQGKRLKKAVTNDRSTPLVTGTVKDSGDDKGAVSGGSSMAGGASTTGSAGPPQLGGLFAGGMPKLKPAAPSAPGKASALGRPPTIPKRTGTTPVPPATSVRSAPSLLPAREPSTGIVPPPPPPPLSGPPAPPRRPPPPTRPASPPPRPSSPPSRPLPSGSLSTPTRTVPLPPVRPSPSSPSLPPRKVPPPPPPISSGRAAPPPPLPRPGSVVPRVSAAAPPSLPARNAPPPPPVRRPPPKLEENAEAPPAPPLRVRAMSAGGAPPAAPSVPVPPPTRSTIGPPMRQPPDATLLGMRGVSPGRRAVSNNLNGGGSMNGRHSAIASRIPSPPPTSGPHTFLASSDFPPPRSFVSDAKKYGSGNVRGSSFHISALA